MAETAGATADGGRPRYGGDVRISSDEWVKDEKTGKMRLSEKGITRQKEDILALASKLGADIVTWYPENDTTAFKKRRIRLPKGRSVWWVFRPEFRRMLADYEDGVIDGVIFYDIDRLARQPRDLEDLIDLVEFYGRPVETVTGNIDLRTSNGRAMARVLVAMANKASEDTSRRVARARLQQAQDGKNARLAGSRRRFGYRHDGTLIPEEAELVRAAAQRFLAGESWGSLIRFFQGSGVRPVYAREWGGPSVRQILLTPTVAGISMYNGVMRAGNPAGRSATPTPIPMSWRSRTPRATTCAGSGSRFCRWPNGRRWWQNTTAAARAGHSAPAGPGNTC
jgi:site-specific DNA recombinase